MAASSSHASSSVTLPKPGWRAERKRAMARVPIGLLMLLYAAVAQAQTDAHPRCVLEQTPECRRVHDREEARDYGIAPVARLAEAGLQARRLLIFSARYDNVGALTF